MGKPKLVSLVVVLLGIAVAFYVTSQNNPSSSPTELGASLKTSGALTYKNLFGGIPVQKTPGLSDENVTDKVIQKYGEELFRLNEDAVQGGFATSSPLTPPSEEFLGSLLSGELDKSLSIPLFQIADIHVRSEKGTEESVRLYGQSFQRISDKNLAGLPAQAGLSTPFLSSVSLALFESKPSSLQSHIAAAKAQVDDLLGLPVPKELSSFHLELLNLWQRRFVIGSALLQNDDPLKNMAALNSLSDAMDKEEEVFALLAP